MKQSKSRVVFVAIGVVALVALLAFYSTRDGGTRTTNEPLTLRIGALIPETGNLAFLGDPMKKSIQLAHDRFQEQLAQQGLAISLVWGDSQGKASEAVTALNRLATVDRINGVMCFLSGPTQAAYPAAKAAGLFYVGLTVEPSYFKQGDTAVRVYYSFRKEGLALSERVAELGWRRVLVLNSTDAATTYEVSQVLIPELTKNGVVVTADDFTVAQKDFKDLVAKHEGGSFDGIILHGFGTDLPRLAEVVNASGRLRTLPRLGSFGSTDIKPALRRLMAGTEFFAPRFAVPDLASPAFTAVKAAFSQKYPGVPFDHSAAYAYDAYAIIVRALLKTQSLDAAVLRAALSQPVEAMSETYHFDPSGDFEPAIVLLRFSTDGEFVPVERAK